VLSGAQGTSLTCKKINRSSSAQQAACWYNNVRSYLVVDATLTINNKMTADTVAASKQAKLLSLISLHLLVTLHAWQAHKLSCRAVQQPSYEP
jgi:hypothetical protein